MRLFPRRFLIFFKALLDKLFNFRVITEGLRCLVDFSNGKTSPWQYFLAVLREMPSRLAISLCERPSTALHIVL
jgi:hypothetical protein